MDREYNPAIGLGRALPQAYLSLYCIVSIDDAYLKVR